MKRRIRRIGAAFLTAALLLQQCAVTGLAEEAVAQEQQVESQSMQAEPEAQAEPAAQAEPEASAEPAAQAEPQTSAPQSETPAPQQSEPQTQAAQQSETPAQSSEPQTQQSETPAQSSEPQTQGAQQSESQAQSSQQSEPQTQGAQQSESQAQSSQQSEPQTQGAQQSESQAQSSQQSEPQTQGAQQSESQAATEKAAETQEKETERSERVNGGKKIDDDFLVGKLKKVLSYLFVADEMSLPEELEESLDASWLVDETEGTALVEGLAELSLTLADGKSTSMVEVLNLYADEKGKLDTEQLTKAFKDKVIDVTDQYYVVNVIAAKKDQTLDFTGYEMVNKGKAVAYEKASQPGDILYNFAYLDGDTYKPFEGTVNLSSGSGLQGTYLAPKATVNVKSDLAGAVYAKQITVADGVKDLMRIGYIDGVPTAEVEKITEAAETEKASEPAENDETEKTPESAESGETDETSEPAENDETEKTPESAEDGGTAEAGSESEAETDTEKFGEDGSVVENGIKIETEVVDEIPKETESETETDPAQSELSAVESELTTDETTGEESELSVEEGELTAEELAVDESELLMARSLMWYSETGTSLNVSFADAADAAAQFERDGAAAIYAAGLILDDTGKAKYKKGDQVAEIRENDPAGAAVSLQYGGNYYLEVTKVPTQISAQADAAAYAAPSRIYFQVDQAGKLVLGSVSGLYEGNSGAGTLKILLQKQAQVTIVLKDADPGVQGLLSGAEFVIKDSAKKIIRSTANDGSSYPAYCIPFNGQEVGIFGLQPGIYYLSEVKAPDGYQVAEDQEFTISASQTGSVELVVTNTKLAADARTIKVKAQSSFGSPANADRVTLTAEQDMELYAALFTLTKDQDGSGVYTRVSEPKLLTYAQGGSATTEAVFGGVSDGTEYYVALTDAFGEAIPAENSFRLLLAGQTSETAGAYAAVSAGADATVDIVYTSYPSDFSYLKNVQFQMDVKNHDGTPRQSADTFYAMLYKDEAYTEKALASPVAIAMNNASTMTVTAQVKVTAAEQIFYLAQTDANGTALRTDDPDFVYAITYPTEQGQTGRQVRVTCDNTPVTARIQDQINATVVKFRLEDGASGALLSGASLIVRNTETGAQTDVFVSGGAETVWENKLAAGSYVLREITAPSGYANTADVAFTVEDGRMTEVVMQNTPVKTTSYKLTAVKQVYNDDAPVYARDTAAGTYAAEGRYTFYAALYSDSARRHKVSDVKKITVGGLSGTAAFENLTGGATYYLTETDQYGNILTSKDPLGQSCKILYTNGGKVTMSSTSQQAVIRNAYSSLPRGYRNTATLTLTKKLQKSSGEADNASKTFYAGIYRKADYSDTPTVVALKLENSSQASAKRRILLSGTKDVTYYIAEVDENGKRITDEAAFGYSITVDQPSVTLGAGDAKNVTITNKTRVSKVTLYLTKKVYQGTSQKAVNATFYAGLFKDPEFTTLYADPIPLKLEGKSEITLKLTLNLGSASEAKIYVAEVDKDGNVVKAGKEFGYDIRVVNATAAFTQEKTEIQSILLNSVYSASSSANWNTILHEDGNNIGGGVGGFGGSSSNGGGGAAENGSVQTGDETPILPYVIGFVAAAVVIIVILLIGRKKKKSRK